MIKWFLNKNNLTIKLYPQQSLLQKKKFNVVAIHCLASKILILIRNTVGYLTAA